MRLAIADRQVARRPVRTGGVDQAPPSAAAGNVGQAERDLLGMGVQGQVEHIVDFRLAGGSVKTARIAGQQQADRSGIRVLPLLHGFRRAVRGAPFDIGQAALRTLAAMRETWPTKNRWVPAQCQQWLDEGRELTLLDVRNDYEVAEKNLAVGLKSLAY